MKTRSLYEILGVTYRDTFYDIVVTEDNKTAYYNAKRIMGSKAECYRDAQLSITTKDRDGITTILEFHHGKNLECIRGREIRTCYLDKDTPWFSEVKRDLETIYKPIIDKLVIKE